MEVTIIVVACIGLAAFRQWLSQQRRMMMHRERLAMIEKGIAPAPPEQESRRNWWNVRRLLLLAGLTWISLGIGAFVVLWHLQDWQLGELRIPYGIQWVGIAPILIGVSHLIVYSTGRGST